MITNFTIPIRFLSVQVTILAALSSTFVNFGDSNRLIGMILNITGRSWLGSVEIRYTSDPEPSRGWRYSMMGIIVLEDIGQLDVMLGSALVDED